ncbi:MAG: tetratricopeptide repeat protein, partial [Acidobacteria bacterium]|nr:tetratricopeptide repeat protein [Acidobacteriota bacterium]
YRKNNQPMLALASYKRALEEDPDYVGALTNLGVTLQESGQPEEAVKIFSRLNQRHPSDRLAESLLRQAQAAIAQKQDLERQRYIDGLVKELVQRYREQRFEERPMDDWTTPALALSILGFQDRSGDDLMEQAGIDTVLQDELTQVLQKANIRVVERAILDKLLAELKLGSSELADPDTALKVGKILAARLIATGSFMLAGDQESTVNLRLIDTETTDIVLPLSERQAGRLDPVGMAEKLAKAIAAAIRDKYPLKGRIALIEGDTVIINLGKKHNITPGMMFNVLSSHEQPVELNGRVLGYRQVPVGRLEVLNVEELMAYAKPIDKRGDWEKNQKIIQR